MIKRHDTLQHRAKAVRAYERSTGRERTAYYTARWRMVVRANRRLGRHPGDIRDDVAQLLGLHDA